MRRTFVASSCAVALLALLTACPGSKGGTTPNGGGGGENNKPKSSRELDKLMRTRMNASYSQLVFLVFHSQGDPNFTAITEEGDKLSKAIADVLKLQMPPVVQSEQARSVYVDYNNTLFRDNERFAEATSKRDLAAMSSSLTKIGETCSACHHFFRVEIKDAAE